MTNPATLHGIDEYLNTSYEPDCDYVDGFIEDRNVGRNSASWQRRDARGFAIFEAWYTGLRPVRAGWFDARSRALAGSAC